MYEHNAPMSAGTHSPTFSAPAASHHETGGRGLPPLFRGGAGAGTERAARLMRLALGFFAGGIALSLLLISPTTWLSTFFLKSSVFTICLAVAAALYLLARRAAPEGWDEPTTKRARRAVALAALIPLAYLVSYYFSVGRPAALIGSGNDTDTLLFAILAYAALFFGYEAFRAPRAAKMLIRTMVGVSLVAVVFQYLNIFFGSKILPASLFGDPTVTLVGKWNELGLLAALAALLLVVRAEFTDMAARTRRLLIAGLVVLTFQLIIINFDLAWALLFVGAVAAALYKYAATRRSPSERPSEYWYAGTIAAIAAVFFLWGSAIGSHLPQSLAISSLEVRPSASATYEIAWAAHGGSPLRDLIGAGPNTFGQEWLLHKSPSVNQTQFWSVSFNSGFSTFLTALSSIGVLGILAWLIPLLVVLCGLCGLRTRMAHLSPDERFAVLGLGLAAAFLWISALFYELDQNVMLLAFIATGAFIGVFGRANASQEAPASLSPRARRVKIIAAVILLIAVALISAFVVRRLVSSAYAQRAAAALGNGEVDAAVALATRSQSIELTEDNLLLGVAINAAQIQNILSASTTSQSEIASLRTKFQTALTQAIGQAQAASALNPQDYQPYVALANIYELVIPLKIQGAYEGAQQAYQEAMVLSPNDPSIPLLLARLEANQDLKGNEADVQKLIGQSIQMKSDYTDAYLMAEQVAVALNDLPSATQAAKSALQSAPDQPSLWFQLGLFYYAGGDMQNAIAALEQTVSMVPQYANAKYFLGLAYAKGGRTSDAVKQFQDLAGSNPDNAEVKLILSNLEAGKDPFAGAKPPITPNPAARQQAPIKE